MTSVKRRQALSLAAVIAGALLLPYLAWVGFASMLTYSIWQRNRDVLA